MYAPCIGIFEPGTRNTEINAHSCSSSELAFLEPRLKLLGNVQVVVRVLPLSARRKGGMINGGLSCPAEMHQTSTHSSQQAYPVGKKLPYCQHACTHGRYVIRFPWEGFLQKSAGVCKCCVSCCENMDLDTSESGEPYCAHTCGIVRSFW